MAGASNPLGEMVTGLVPSLSRSLAEQFNVFRVMHHGTHEKQLSNVFGWLLRVDGSHGLGNRFQRLFVEQVNLGIPAGSQTFPTSDYRVVQEVNTSGLDDLGKDIADIVLTNEQASIVIENFESSDGHGHDYHRYLAHGAGGDKLSVVVLLCARRETHRQTRGWENAVVLTYADLLDGLRAQTAKDAAWQRENPQQHFFINELFGHFLEVPGAMSTTDQISFIKAMCDTGESARYGFRPQERAAQEFADLVAQHAKRQFDEGRMALARVKKTLKRYAEQTLIGKVNEALTSGHITSAQARLVGKWEWCVTLDRADSAPTVFLLFGPTVVVENGIVEVPLVDPDYTKVFVARKPVDHRSLDHIRPTDVGLDEVLAGLVDVEDRLLNAVIATINAT